jgi:hypothetical protein
MLLSTTVLIALVINAFFDAFGDEAPWADEQDW